MKHPTSDFSLLLWPIKNECLLSSPAVQLHIHYYNKGVMAWQFNKEQVVLTNPWHTPFLWIKTRCWFYLCRSSPATVCVCVCVVFLQNFHWGLQHKSRLNCWSLPNDPPLNAFLSRPSWARPVDLCVNSLLALSSPLTGSTDTESNHFIGAVRNEELSKVLLLSEDELASRH